MVLAAPTNSRSESIAAVIPAAAVRGAERPGVLPPANEPLGGQQIAAAMVEKLPAGNRETFVKLSTGRSAEEVEVLSSILSSRLIETLPKENRTRFDSQLAGLDAAGLIEVNKRIGALQRGDSSGYAVTPGTPAAAAVETVFAHQTSVPEQYSKYTAERSFEDRMAIGVTINYLGFGSMKPEDQQQLLTIMEGCDTKRLWDLSMLTGLDPGSSRLLAKDSKGRSMLGSLHDIFTSPTSAGPELAAAYHEWKLDTVSTLANPNRICQGAKRTCTATEIMRRFANERPAELSGVIRDICLTGKAKLQDGKEMLLETDSVNEDNSRRTIIERVVQSAFMQFAQGESDYRNLPDETIHRGGGVSYGLDFDAQARLLSSLYGEKYVPVKEVPEKMLNIIQRHSPAPILTSLRWDTSGSPEAHSSHMVSVSWLGESKSFISNPWGREAGGDVSSGPNLETIDGDTGMQALTSAEVRRRIVGVVVPASYLREKK